MMGMLIRFFCTRFIPIVVLGIAIFVGWLSTQRIPEATLFTMIYPVMKGYLPPLWSGGFQESPVPPLVPNEFTLEPRPVNEKFILLPGGGGKAPSSDGAVTTTTSYHMPQNGLGMCCRYTAYDPESVRRTILHYIRLGGRHIDTADLYLNHVWIGEALKLAMTQYNVSREELWITTKLWPRSYGRTTPGEIVQQSLQDLQLDYIDLILMHAPSHKNFNFLGSKSECELSGWDYKECRLETWKALSVLRNDGLVHHVGVANFLVKHLQEIQFLIDTDDNAGGGGGGDGPLLAPIANNQFQFNPWMPEFVHETKTYCQQHGISMTAYSSFSGSVMQHMQAFTVQTLTNIASHHKTTVAQILLAWATQTGFIVIPGTSNPHHMAENLQAYNIQLSESEMKAIDALKDDESAKDFFVGPPDDT